VAGVGCGKNWKTRQAGKRRGKERRRRGEERREED